MKSFRTFAISGLIGAVIAGMLINPVLAAQPRGTIKKFVQNQTTNSARADADSMSTAIEAKSGDILKYSIEVSNEGDSDMFFTNLVDTIPSGVELVSDTSQNQINEDLGVLAGGRTVTKEYLVRVTTKAKQGDLIDNKACFTGNSEDKNAAQNGCNNAIVKVTAAQPAPQPQTPAAPAEEHPAPIIAGPTPPATPNENLPTTGPTAVATTLASLSAGSLGYAGRLFVLQHRNKRHK